MHALNHIKRPGAPAVVLWALLLLAAQTLAAAHLHAEAAPDAACAACSLAKTQTAAVAAPTTPADAFPTRSAPEPRVYASATAGRATPFQSRGPPGR